jgi:hypothetical protein
MGSGLDAARRPGMTGGVANGVLVSAPQKNETGGREATRRLAGIAVHPRDLAALSGEVLPKSLTHC